MKDLLNLGIKYKYYSLAIIIILLVSSGYFAYQKIVKAESIQYLSQDVFNGTLITSVSGVGQVSASSQVELKPKVAGDVIAVKTKLGQVVKKGDVLVQLDSRDGLRAVKNAQTSLETARLSLAKIKSPADPLSLFQSENSLLSAQQAKIDAEDKLKKSYEDGFNTVSNVFLDLPTIMADLDNLLYNNDFEKYQTNMDWYSNQGYAYAKESFDSGRITLYKQDVINYYQKARASYDHNFDKYKIVNRASSEEEIGAIILETYETSKIISDTIKSAKNFIDLIDDLMQKSSKNSNVPAKMISHKNLLSTYTGQINSHLSSLLATKNNIDNYKNSIVNATNSIKERELSLEKIKAGSDVLDIRLAEISVQQKLDALYEAQTAWSDYSIKAPFDGIVAAINVKVGDSVSSGNSLVTIVTDQSMATIVFNEIDVAKVKVSQKASLTFDAVSELTITGEVVEVDSLGTTNSGVVSYSVKIIFDIQDDRIKSGMTASADIILNSKVDVLLVPSGSIKIHGDQHYVEVLVGNQPEKKNVTIGLSNDTMTEITSGLSEGEQIITQTILSGSKPVTTSNPATTGGALRGATTGSGGGTFRMGGF